MTTQTLQLIRNWLKTQTDKSQAKLDTMAIQSWLKELNLDPIIAGSEALPSVPTKSPEWATDLRNYLASLIKMQPGEVKSTVQDINVDLDTAIKEIIAEIGSYVAPPSDATPSQTAALANSSKILALCEKFPNNPTIQQIKQYTSESVGYINKIASEVSERANEDLK